MTCVYVHVHVHVDVVLRVSCRYQAFSLLLSIQRVFPDLAPAVVACSTPNAVVLPIMTSSEMYMCCDVYVHLGCRTERARLQE